MLDALETIVDHWPLFLFVFCAVPLILSAALVVWIMRRVTRMTSPSVERIQGQYAKLSAKQPAASDDQYLRQIIHQQAVRAGVVGAVTSVGGFWTLPITLPIDMALSTQIQASMVDFIAAHYGRADNQSDIERRIRTYIITAGGLRLTRSTTRWLLRSATWFMGRSFAKLIPLAGALIGFGVNYGIARATGTLALRYYSGKIALPDRTT